MNVSFRRDKTFQHDLKYHLSMKKTTFFKLSQVFLSFTVVFLSAIKYSTKYKNI